MQGDQKSHGSRPQAPASGSCPSAKCHLFGVLVAVFLALMNATAQPGYTIVRSFGFPDQSGEFPDHIFAGSDGAFYGAAALGRQWQPSPGNEWRGALFKMQPDGSGYTILHRFSPGQMVSDLLEATNGVLYGTTYSGGQSNFGTVFKLNRDGSSFEVLHHFLGTVANDGESPCGLLQASDGVLYGTTTFGAADTNCPAGCGTIFQLQLDGSNYSIVRNFSGSGGDGRNPYARVIEASNGFLYGTTQAGGTSNLGTIFKLEKGGTAYSVHASFAGTNGASPKAALLEGADGALYGTTQTGGSTNLGTVFRAAADHDAIQVLHHFTGGSSDSYGPTAALVPGPDGALYGATLTTAWPACAIIFKLNPDGSGYQVLRQCVYSASVCRVGDAVYGTSWDQFFKLTDSSPGYTIIRYFRVDGGDGYWPTHLFEGRDGVLYGTTYGGGSMDGGTVFRMNKDGTGYLLLRSFNNPNLAPDVPFGLIEGTDGLLYGSTRGGGTSYSGTIFKMNKDGGEFATLFNFASPIGREPRQIIEGSDGALYGTTRGDGSRCGTIFRINRDGTGHTILHRFGIDDDNGWYAPASLFEGSDGWLYGVSIDDGYQTGQIYRLRKDGTGYMELYTFSGLDGRAVDTLPAEAFDGTLYGTTTGGGVHNAGIVFNIRKDGSGFKKLFDFPVSEGHLKTVMLASDQVLYGVTYATTSTTIGTLFKLNRDGSKYSVLHSFNDATGDGSAPRTPIFEGSDGALYGTTIVGGAMNLGTIFRLVPSPEVTLVRNHVSNEVQITARALSRNTLTFEVSSDLKTWAPLASGIVTNGQFTADDPEVHHPSRFYRARLGN